MIPERALLASVVQLAVLELHSTPSEEEIAEQRNRSAGREEDRPDPHGAADFIFGGGEWFDRVCDYLGVEPGWVRERILANAQRAHTDPNASPAAKRAGRALLLRVQFYRRWQAAAESVEATSGACV